MLLLLLTLLLLLLIIFTDVSSSAGGTSGRLGTAQAGNLNTDAAMYCLMHDQQERKLFLKACCSATHDPEGLAWEPPQLKPVSAEEKARLLKSLLAYYGVDVSSIEALVGGAKTDPKRQHSLWTSKMTAFLRYIHTYIRIPPSSYV